MNDPRNNKWIFAENNNCQFQGVGATGISLFKGTPIKSLAREICQNSIDAWSDHNKPVKVEFKTFDIPMTKLPGVDSLKPTVAEILKYIEREKLSKEEKIFSRMSEVLSKDSIHVLRISDFNTTGIKGAEQPRINFNTPWSRLVRSEGSSAKQEGSMGSFGSGHLSVFVTSGIRTVFYSTLDSSDNHIQAYEGVARLMGHIDSSNNQRSDVGYYGLEGTSMPIMEQLHLDPDFIRTEPGTDIYSMAFNFQGDEWQKELIASVLDGFFYAIYENNLIVEAEGVEISKKTIGSLMEKYNDSIDKRTIDYYHVLVDEEVETKQLSMYEDGDVLVKMKIEKKLSQRVAIIRWPGMKIFDRGYISTAVQFAGVCVIKGQKISDLFKGIENIQHTKWELNRYDEEPEKKNDAKKYEDKLFKDLKDIFDSIVGKSSSESIDPGIGDCLPDPSADNDNEVENISDKTAEISSKKADIPSNTDSTPEIFDKEGGKAVPKNDPPKPHPPYPGPIPPIPGPEPGPNPAPNPDKTGDQTKDKAKLVQAKVRVIGDSNNTGTYTLIITPRRDIKDGFVSVSLAGETGSYDASVTSATIENKSLNCDGKLIYLPETAAGTKLKLKIAIGHLEMSSLEVRVYGK